MKLLDLENAIAGQLGRLPYPAYLCSMCIIGMELQVLYADLLPENGRLLAGQTIDVARAALMSADTVTADADQISRRWQELLDDPATDGPTGMFSTIITFHILARELAGELRPHAALHYLTGAATELPDPRIPEPAGPELVRVDASEQADESSPGVRLLRKFGEVATIAARQHGTGRPCDPDQLYPVVFG